MEILDVALIGAKFYYEKQIRFDTKYYVQLLKEISELQNEVEKAVVPADVRPVVRGKWIKYAPHNSDMMTCSECEKYWILDGDQYDFNFCPNCGADMRNSESTSI